MKISYITEAPVLTQTNGEGTYRFAIADLEVGFAWSVKFSLNVGPISSRGFAEGTCNLRETCEIFNC
jgi:hypothetical protein